MTDREAEAREAAHLARQIGRLLAGKPAGIALVAVADVTATLLAGWRVKDNPGETQNLRNDLLDNHIRMIERLIPINGPE